MEGLHDRREVDGARRGARVKLEGFDIGGRRVATLVDGLVAGGPQLARWNGFEDATGRAAAPGVYLCRLEVPGISSAPSRATRLLRLR